MAGHACGALVPGASEDGEEEVMVAGAFGASPRMAPVTRNAVEGISVAAKVRRIHPALGMTVARAAAKFRKCLTLAVTEITVHFVGHLDNREVPVVGGGRKRPHLGIPIALIARGQP